MAYRRGHRPFNKGKSCARMGVTRKPRGVCRKFGHRRGRRYCIRRGVSRKPRPVCRSYGGHGGRYGASRGRGIRTPFSRTAYADRLIASRRQAMIEAQEGGGGLPSWAEAARFGGRIG